MFYNQPNEVIVGNDMVNHLLNGFTINNKCSVR
jgi:hypothetical protein